MFVNIVQHGLFGGTLAWGKERETGEESPSHQEPGFSDISNGALGFYPTHSCYLVPESIILFLAYRKLFFPMLYTDSRFLECRGQPGIAFPQSLQFCFPFLYIGRTENKGLELDSLTF